MEANPQTQPNQSPPEVMPPQPPVRNLPEHDTEAIAGVDAEPGFGADDEPAIPEAEGEPKREAPASPSENTSKHM